MNFLKRSTFKYNLILFICLLFCSIAIALFFITHYFISNIITDKSLTYFKETITQIAYRVDTEISIRNQFVSKVTLNPTITYYLKDIINKNKSKELITSQIMAEVLRLKPNEINSLQDIYIFPRDGYPVNCYYSEAMTETDPYSKLLINRLTTKNSEKTIWDDFYLEQDRISSYTPILDKDKVVGLVRIRYTKNFLGNIIDNVQLSNNNLILITDGSGNIIYSNNCSLIGKNLQVFNQNQNYIIRSTFINGDWSIIGIVPHSVVSNQIAKMSIVFLTLYLITFAFILMAVTIYSNRVLKPLNNIVNGMREIQNGNLDVNIKTSSSDEFGFISENFNYMVYRIKSLVSQIYNQQKAYQQASMAALEAKLSPHFLYNTLDAIYWMLITKENFSEADMVIKLSNILRYSISHNGDFVHLSEDIAQIESYIALQQCRFGDSLKYTISIEEGIENVRIPKLLLQPLVENVIKHGFKDMGLDGFLQIECRTNGENILFTIKDNGVGIPQNTLENIFTYGFGLRITRDRIYYIYGEKYGLEIKSQVGRGTEITVIISRHPSIDFDYIHGITKNDNTKCTGR